MNRLLQRRATGTPNEFASRLGVSRTRLYEMIDELKSYGAPISYSKSVQTFYYEEPYDVSVALSVKSLDADEEKKHHGGAFFVPAYFFSGRCIRIFTERNVTVC